MASNAALLKKSSMENANYHSLPKHPVLTWTSLRGALPSPLSSIENLKYTAFTTSGRAAIYQALCLLGLPAGSTVLVPSYHCPTMVAPILLAHLKVAYFAIKDDGLPNLSSIDTTTAQQCKAILVPHYFGFSNSLHEVRDWCDARGVALIEDCAHCYFGQAGERALGAWGDYATASLSKFFPVQEGGVLASSKRSVAKLHLKPPTMTAQVKGFMDVLETSSKYNGLYGLNTGLKLIFKLKKLLKNKVRAGEKINQDMISYCDMARIDNKLLLSSLLIKYFSPSNMIVKKRQRNYAQYENHFKSTTQARPLFNLSAKDSAAIAPYVFPLWVDDADRIYQVLKELNFPVFRWDKLWPGTPIMINDAGPGWSKHVLQLLCHQDLASREIDAIAKAITQLLPQPSA
jgi:dTDP-4-amino-4,6-dideoxygalactose transaminase